MLKFLIGFIVGMAIGFGFACIMQAQEVDDDTY